jgi:hypothetical protein
MLGDDDRQLVGPRVAAGLPQPCVLRLDRGHQVVEGVERAQVVKRHGDRELVVAVGPFRGERTGEVHHAVHVRLVRVIAGVVAVGPVAMRLEDLLGQRQAAHDLGRGHGPIVRPVP